MSKICFNIYCGATSTIEWKSGWPLQYGGLANLCDKCGHAYENGEFCEKFHAEELGWRECTTCSKKLHCGCVASLLLVELRCPGGVKCVPCARDEFPNLDASENNANGNRDFSLVAPSDCMPVKFAILDGVVSSPSDGSTTSTLYMIQPRTCYQLYDIRPQNRDRYWPKVTEEELKQIFKNPSCAIIPLFDKILSASDARTSRLVLPKSCVEAYFPDMSDMKGAPLTFQDVNGRNWEFKFRIWSNGDSKMYALDGVQTYIQSMQLQPNDIVTFSRKIPEMTFILGFRKSLNCGEQDDAGGSNTEGSRNLGSKEKRLSWTTDEALGMLRPHKCLKPEVVVVDDFEIEAYGAPPVFGKKSVFAVDSSRMVEQWTKCDICFKWRKLRNLLPLSDTWTCMDNIWDSARNSCNVPEEANREELENLLYLTKGVRENGLALVKEAMKKEKASVEAIEGGISAVATTPKLKTENEELAISAVGITPKLKTENEELAISAVGITPELKTENEELAISAVGITPELKTENEELAISAVGITPKLKTENEELEISAVGITPELKTENEELAISAVATTSKPETERDVPESSKRGRGRPKKNH